MPTPKDNPFSRDPVASISPCPTIVSRLKEQGAKVEAQTIAAAIRSMPLNDTEVSELDTGKN